MHAAQRVQSKMTGRQLSLAAVLQGARTDWSLTIAVKETCWSACLSGSMHVAPDHYSMSWTRCLGGRLSWAGSRHTIIHPRVMSSAQV